MKTKQVVYNNFERERGRRVLWVYSSNLFENFIERAGLHLPFFHRSTFNITCSLAFLHTGLFLNFSPVVLVFFLFLLFFVHMLHIIIGVFILERKIITNRWPPNEGQITTICTINPFVFLTERYFVYLGNLFLDQTLLKSHGSGIRGTWNVQWERMKRKENNSRDILRTAG